MKRWAGPAVTFAVVAAIVGGLLSIRDRFDTVAEVLFDFHVFGRFLPSILRGFRVNVTLFLMVEAIVLVWGLLLAVARLAPGRWSAPLRWAVVAYTDLFRGLPAIVTIYLIGFGLPLLELPGVSALSDFQLAALALTLVYGAYVAEVYRSGIESVHPSQMAAARSLGLTHGQAMRHVVVPQAVRRIVPPLLNDFIGLQKDTALVQVIGVLDAFNRARIASGQVFNLSPVVGLGLCFVLITVPMSRLVDHLTERDRRRRLAGS